MKKIEKCPFCGSELVGDDSKNGQNVLCPNCNKEFVFGNTTITAPEPNTLQASPLRFLRYLLRFLRYLLRFLRYLLRFLRYRLRFFRITKTDNSKLSCLNVKNELRILIILVIIFGSLLYFKSNNSNGSSALGTSAEPIVDYKVVYYSWENGKIAEQLNETIKEGYEPIGYLCNNGTSGGAFLFAKRGKKGTEIHWVEEVAYGKTKKPASHFEEMTMKQIQPNVFHTTMPSSPTELFVYASLDDYYNYGYIDLKADYYSIAIDNYGHGYVKRYSKCGKMLYELLKDGKKHKVIVNVMHSYRSQGCGDLFDILSATTEGVDK